MTFEEKMLMRCFRFEQEFKMNKLGVFLLDKNEIKDIEISTNEKLLFFGRVEDNIWLSRGKDYYCLGISSQTIKIIRKNLNYAISKNYKTLIYALNEFILNHLAIFWYNLKYNQKKLDCDMACRLFQQLKNISSNLLNALLDNSKYNNLDWEFLIYVVNNVHINEEDFRVPECDNKVDIVKEICWLIHSKLIDKVDAILLPMYGSFQLMLFASVILEKKCYPINIGFHDQTERKELNYSEPIFQGKRVLVLDDNIGSGNTIKWCKNWVNEQGSCCITRVCEIPWDIYCRINKYDVIRENLDMPSIKNNFRILSKDIFIQSIKAEDYSKIFNAEHLYVKEDVEMRLMNKRILRLKESNQFLEVQIENMLNEFNFYKRTLGMMRKYV